MLHKKIIIPLVILAIINCCPIFALVSDGNQQHLSTYPLQQTSPVQTTTATPTTKQLVQKYIDLETRPWSILFYIGSTSKTQLGQLIQGKYGSAHETLYSAELAYTLKKENIIRRILNPLVSTVQVAGNLAYRIEHRNDSPKITEEDLYIVLRWTNFPWNNYITTTLAAGEGISYVSHIPHEETDGTTSNDSHRLLNYLMFEATFALPSHPEWQLVARIHHRSNAYGTFGSTNGGSNNLGLGIRYSF